MPLARLGSVTPEEEDIDFGRAALRLGLVPRDVLSRALAWQRANAPRRRLRDVLVDGNVLTREQAAEVEAARAADPPGRSTAVALGPTPRPEDEDPLLGTVLAGCFVNAKLGAGAMATVYLAWHGELRKDVVIKVLSHEHAKQPRTVERFRREASAMARVDHPNVVMVFDLGQTPDGRPFSVLQYVDGQDLDKRMKARGRLELEEATRIVLDVARGLQAAHEKGVIHRDIKPENIMLTSSGTAKVTDFGLAKDMTLAPMTFDGTFIGTPLYMAPEIGGKAPIDARVDIYSLGLTYYYLLTGVEPMRDFTAQEVLHKVAHGKLKPPDVHRPDLPDAYRRVLGHMLARARDDRYPDMNALARDLEALLRGLPVEAPEPSLWPRDGAPGAASEATRPAGRREGARPRAPRKRGASASRWSAITRRQAVALAASAALVLLLAALLVLVASGRL